MTDNVGLGRWCRFVKICPNSGKPVSSWNDKTLTTQEKIYAIKISDGELEPINSKYHLLKTKTRSCLNLKWLGKCKWKLPKTMILFSVLQIFFYLIGPKDLAYQTLAFSPVKKFELWRYFTYSFLHAGITHLLLNVVLQIVLAVPLESEAGPLSVMCVYSCGILSGSLAASISPDFTLLVGSSSGVYSLLMSHIPQIYINFSTISYRAYRIIFVTVLALGDIIYATIHSVENREPQIALRSHIAGALSGVLLGFIFYKTHGTGTEFSVKDDDRNLKILRITSLVCFLSFIAVVIIVNCT